MIGNQKHDDDDNDADGVMIPIFPQCFAGEALKVYKILSKYMVRFKSYEHFIKALTDQNDAWQSLLTILHTNGWGNVKINKYAQS